MRFECRNFNVFLCGIILDYEEIYNYIYLIISAFAVFYGFVLRRWK